MAADNLPPVLLDFPSEGVARLRLNRPQATNALSLELQAQLSQHFSELGNDPAVRCIVLTGGDKVFAAGGDITSMAGVGAIDIYQRHTERVWAPIQHCPKPVIAAVCGYAYGGGCELAMLADIIVAGHGAKFCQPEIRIGIMPGIGGTQRLVRAVGKAKAMSMALTGRPISAEEAWVAGLVSELVADEEVQDHALAMARTIAGMPPLAAEQIKEVIIAGLDASLETGLALERKANALLFASRDQKEGMQAFIDKRAPRFEGR
ncbi:Enoyl-CoA hydratase/carnithine racemase [Pseudomonas linyingensis]|jgi:enoyl-CoA hydratase|uniref:Enoyl-CoA hydratase/carnithine racemase n=1 Tax=Pseudomonas linyingensis TaxID=915471 RepID=A0A1H6ZR74_9PSED|nr:enoyl-CoA hydratase [Pseudomonas linyingensis]MCM2319657.1 enoyl-CoA hydratase [Pseudomonas sp.]SEJ52110.1 Enoyl-CoA hydratase/carnithine racemase [Pseudomonas linyingensis]